MVAQVLHFPGAAPAKLLILLGSARVSRAGDGVLAIANFLFTRKTSRRRKLSEKIVSARRRNQHARRVRYPDRLLARRHPNSLKTPLSAGSGDNSLSKTLMIRQKTPLRQRNGLKGADDVV